MKIFIADTYEELSLLAADNVMQLMQKSAHQLICTASGDSPAGLYKMLVNNIVTQQLNINSWSFVGLDEWAGMNGNTEGSCRYHLNQQLFHPLQLHEEKICFFDGKANDLNAECKKVETFIQEKGGIEVAVVGLGLNGHLGMNEPGTSFSVRSHVAAIDAVTQKVGQKYFKEPQEISKGLTLGLATIMEARHVFLLVSGAHKAQILQQVLEGEIAESLPASILRKHSNLYVFTDKSAAAMLQK